MISFFPHTHNFINKPVRFTRPHVKKTFLFEKYFNTELLEKIVKEINHLAQKLNAKDLKKSSRLHNFNTSEQKTFTVCLQYLFWWVGQKNCS